MINIDEFLGRIKNNNLAERYCMFFMGVYIYAFAFSLIFDRYNIVIGGTPGLSIIFKEIFGISPSIFTFVVSFLILIIGYFTLGMKYTANTIIGIFILPLFMYSTGIFKYYIDFGDTSRLALMIYGGILIGFANGIIIKTGFSVGGVQTLCQIINKYFGVSIGKANMCINFVIIMIGVYSFGLSNAIYAFMALYLSSVIMDKVILGVSDSKAFYVITSHDNEVRDYIINSLHHSVTLLDAKGGYSNKGLKVLLCVIPTREYLMAKEVISEIDKDAFYIITDLFEVLGGI